MNPQPLQKEQCSAGSAILQRCAVQRGAGAAVLQCSVVQRSRVQRRRGAKHSPLFLSSLAALGARIPGIQLICDSEVHLNLRIHSYGSRDKF